MHLILTLRSELVSIHAPVEGATCPLFLQTYLYLCFNPRSRGGSDKTRRSPDCWFDAFQSTLPWRERLLMFSIPDIAMSFQSTLPWRERRKTKCVKPFNWWFQSTLPWRERPWYCCTHIASSCVSIHAPVEGATLPGGRVLYFSKCFNPRSRGGSDTWALNIACIKFMFQSTLPWRERL